MKQTRMMLDPLDELQAIADRMRERIEAEQDRADRLQAELKADKARHAEQLNEMRLALTICLDAMKGLKPTNESAALQKLAAKTTAAALIKGAA